MAPPGRRRFARLSPGTVVLALLVLFTSTASAASAVLGVDLGTEYIKAALVKPGIPLEIVLTKDSKRKELSAVSFKPSKSGALSQGTYPERFYGSDAVALQARFSGDVYPNLKQLLGIPEDSDAVKIYSERYPAVEVTSTEGRSTVSLKSGIFSEEKDRLYSVEELLAMELQNVRENAKAMAGKGTTIEDVVFTVPPFYTVDERRALEVAAKLAGLKTLSVISDGLAVGINYATSRTFPVASDGGKPEVNLVFDVGAGSASATVLKFQGKQVKDVGRFNKTIQEVQVLGSGWDRTLGGDALNTLLFNDMVSSFVELPGTKSASVTAEKVKAHGRTAAKLWKEAEKVRQVLSANTKTQAFFEGLYEDIDFRYKIDRQRFEELTADYAARVDGPINRALEAAGLTFDDIDSLIVHGGASRTPFVQSRLEVLAGKNKIKANVNSDEAAVFGAAFKAAGLSPSFRVKEIRDLDTQGYTHGVEYMLNMKKRDQKIFTPSTKIGATKDLPFQMMGEFEFDIYQTIPGAGQELIKAPVLNFRSGNLTRVVTKMIDDDGCDRETFNNYVQVRLSPVTGTPEITSAWVTCVTEVEEAKGGIVDGIKGFFGGGKKDQEPLKEDESSTESASSGSASSGASSSTSAEAEPSEAAKGGKKRKDVKSAITFHVTAKGYEKHPRKEFKRMQDRLSAFDASDKSRRVREEVLNSLEAFTYRARDYLEDKSFITASTSSIRSSLEEKLSAASDWIYAEGHDAAEDALSARLKELKDLVDPVLKRKDESAKRPDAVQELKDAIEGIKSMVPMVKEQIESAAEASKKAEEEASKASATPSSSASSSATDDSLADLEDDTYSSSTSAEAAIPTPEIPTIYTAADLKFLEDAIEKSEKWLEEKTSAQTKLKETDDAAFSIQDLKTQAKKLNDAVTDMMTKKMRAFQQQQQQKPKTKAKKPKTKKPKKDKAKKDEEKADTENGQTKEPTEDELADALEKAGLKGKNARFENLKALKDKDGKPLTKLEINPDSTEEEIMAAIDRATQAGREAKEREEREAGKHDEL
ncbi:heat shock protein 70-like protein-like protein [Lophiostoma macrostomum CBS 122681]|uniref:Heat shock protein 70-like protein-like protein n=1 Tax=Lophiostoma macrostomum CBS 122681 TaxID=1314788 RepID=A0A6A6SVT3_9PLEO|nr:heat shock protein 70-like protein-like protein [Lophiostoma macrostomum CBS 122681]